MDPNIVDKDGQTAEQLAKASFNDGALAAFAEVADVENEPLQQHLKSYFDEIRKKYEFVFDTPEPVTAQWNASFEAPEFLNDRNGTGFLPNGMRIHEHQIPPLVEVGGAMGGMHSYRCLDFARNEASLNQDRRAALLKAGDPSWDPDS